MNPANDYAKKDLPDSLRNRFTEFYVDEANAVSDIAQIVSHYLPALADTRGGKLKKALVGFYLKMRKERGIRDMSGKSATISLRTLARCLQSARDVFGSSPTGINQTIELAFKSGLDQDSTKRVNELILGGVENYTVVGILVQKS